MISSVLHLAPLERRFGLGQERHSVMVQVRPTTGAVNSPSFPLPMYIVDPTQPHLTWRTLQPAWPVFYGEPLSHLLLAEGNVKPWIIGAACALTVAVNIPLSSKPFTDSPGCGSMENAQGELEGFEKYFRSADYANVRRNVIRRLTANDSQMVVTNGETCRKVLQAALTMLRRYDPNWSEVEQRGYGFTVLRYGPYDAILIKEKDDPATGPAAYYPLIIFESRGLVYVTTIIV